MSYANPINVEDIDIDKIEIRVPKKGGGNAFGNTFHVYHDGVRLRTVLPEMTAPFGGGNSERFPDIFNLGLSFEGMDVDDKRGRRLARAHEKLVALDEKLKQLMVEKRDILFPKEKKTTPAVVIQSKYQSFITSPEGRKDIIYFSLQPTILSKDKKEKMSESEIAEAKRHFQAIPNYPLLVDNTGAPIPVNVDNVKEVLPWGCRVKAVVDLAYLFVNLKGDKCNPKWTVGHAMRASTAGVQTFDITRDDDDEEEEEEGEEEGDEEMVDEEEEALASA